MKYNIVNLVAVSNLNTTVDLYNLAIALPNVEYEPEQFPGAILKLKEPKATITIFKNGKINCAGVKKETDIAKAITNASKMLKQIQPNMKIIKDPKYTVVNLVANAQIDMTIDLFDLAMKLDNVEYEPEQFPGAIVRFYNPRVSLLLFKNGKLICAGAKSEKDVIKSLDKISKLLKEF